MAEKISRVTLVVLDSAGVGALPDADKYGDEGSNTFLHCAREAGGLYLPNLARLGLGNILDLPGIPPAAQPAGAFGKMAELSPGKDTTTGHWEIAGLILDKPFPLYPDGFPPEVISAFEERIGRPSLGNKPASGTVIIEELGPEHMHTGYPIVYTSADSVFQIAAHEEIIPLEELYRMCGIARKLLCGEHAVGRVIARPFIGRPGSFHRTAGRHDYSLAPTGPTLLDMLVERGLAVLAVGKIEDIFAGKGITRAVHTVNNMDGIDQTIKMMQGSERGLIFTNLVDFDMVYGHRNDVRGYADALEAFDRRLPEIISSLRDDEVLIITADHGCDPTTPGTDHTREYVPLLAAGAPVLPGISLGTRETFADLAASVAEMFGFGMPSGRSFAGQILRSEHQS
ncbi:MAG TPA: phosphopentomutase [Desulfotomaculum sp.]|nr:MAG: Phosphopentomutase [Desulfotomaculum sp. 46_80]HAG11275.1 phosphopentomutase [Desulfotomaculum sp.]HBY03577.1 phosphopentomutase [Desulfotomaculum sp.]